MNKDKLISLIIRKQTYKDAKPCLNDLLNLKEQSVKSSSQAVKQILTTDYNAEAKLYAVRFLKDAFETGNPTFIGVVEKDILPIMINIACDENDEKSIIKYAGSSYTKNQELTKFKTIISSLFRMVKECIIKWGEWISDPNRKFFQAVNELRKKNVNFDFEFKYFRPENQQLFMEHSQKNGIKQPITNSKVPTVIKTQVKQTKDPLVQSIQNNILKVYQVKSEKQLQKVENDFNEAINNYLENAKDFKEEFVQESLDKFEKLKKQITSKLKSSNNNKKQESDPKLVQTNSPKLNQGITPKPIQPQKRSEKQLKVETKSSKKQISEASSPKIATEVKISIENEKSQSQNKKINKNQPQRSQTSKQQSANSQGRKTSQESSNALNIDTEKLLQISKTKQQQKIEKSSKIPTSPKRGPISFEEKLPKKQVIKKEEKEPSKSNKLIVEEVKNSKIDYSVSKDSEKVHFSDESQEQQSEDGIQRVQNSKFKKNHLATIQQQNSRIEDNKSPSNFIDSFKSPLSNKNVKFQQQSFNSKDKKHNSFKLMEQNNILMEKCQRYLKEIEVEKQQKVNLIKEKKNIQKELQIRRENQEKLVKKIKTSVPIQDYNKLRKQLEKERQQKQDHNKILKELQEQKDKRLFQESLNKKLKNQYESLIEQLNEAKSKLLNISSRQSKIKQNFESQLHKANQKSSLKVNPPYFVQEVDQDYIKNLTHPSNISAWLNKVNIVLFKRNILGLSEIFYRDDYVTIFWKSSVYTQNNQQFLSVKLTCQFKSLKQVQPAIKYKNCQQLDLWNKPLIGQDLLYSQQLAVKLHSNPLKIMKAEMNIIETINLTFLLPLVYLNYLREEQFSTQQFEEIFSLKSEQFIKSKIVQWNQQVAKQVVDIQKIFKSSILVSDKIRFCLSEGIDDQIFMGQFQILRNNKFLLRILPIPYSQKMIIKAKELLQNILFLLS